MLTAEAKHRRMAIRHKIGNRAISPLPEPKKPYPPYLVAHACFRCRKSFKLLPERDHVCPECGNAVYLMGRAFKAPRRADTDQWRKVQKLYALGFRFHRYGGDYEPLPERLCDVDEFAEHNPQHELRIAEEHTLLLRDFGKR